MSPEVFCFADYPCHTVAIDILKAPPEDDNREIATWLVLSHLNNLVFPKPSLFGPSVCLILSFRFGQQEELGPCGEPFAPI